MVCLSKKYIVNKYQSLVKNPFFQNPQTSDVECESFIGTCLSDCSEDRFDKNVTLQLTTSQRLNKSPALSSCFPVSV